MSDLVGNPEDRFSCNAAHFRIEITILKFCFVNLCVKSEGILFYIKLFCLFEWLHYVQNLRPILSPVTDSLLFLNQRKNVLDGKVNLKSA